jgi:phosphatidylinositol alpha 1,6-mannosyltransferase
VRAAIVTGTFTPSQEPVATTVKHLVDELVRRGHRPLVLTTGVGPATYRGVRVVRLRDGDGPAAARELEQYLPDLVHVADPRLLGTVALRAAHRLGLPTVVSHHSSGTGVLGEWASAKVAGRATRTLASSLPLRERLETAGVPTALWRSGVDTELYRPEMRSPTLVDSWSRSGRCLVVGHVGPVDGPNVQRRLAEVAALTGVRLVAVRAGEGAERLRSRVPGAKVLGDVSGVDLAHAVASYDVLVQPRRKEQDCHGVRRGLASGVPVVGLDTGGVTDLVAHGVNGLLGDPQRPHALRDAVARLRDEPALRDGLALRARDSATRTWADAVDELLGVHWAAVLPELAHSG